MGWWDDIVDLFTPDPEPPKETEKSGTYGLGSQLKYFSDIGGGTGAGNSFTTNLTAPNNNTDLRDNPTPSVGSMLTTSYNQAVDNQAELTAQANAEKARQEELDRQAEIARQEAEERARQEELARQAEIARQQALTNARSARETALGEKQAELASAFGIFNDDYYSDLSNAYTEFQNPRLQQAYDDSLRGIWEGFKSVGLLTQAEVDSRTAGLANRKAEEQARIAQSAEEYASTKRADVDKKMQTLGDQLSALSGGATTLDEINQQTENIRNFKIQPDVDKLKTPSTKTGMDFLTGFNQVKDDPSFNPAPLSTFGDRQEKDVLTQGYKPRGVQSPFTSGQSARVVG